MSDLVELAKNGDLVRIRELVTQFGVDINARHPPDGTTALYWSACSGHVVACDWLLRHGAGANLPTVKSGSMPLHGAADRGHHDCAFLLLRK